MRMTNFLAVWVFLILPLQAQMVSQEALKSDIKPKQEIQSEEDVIRHRCLEELKLTSQENLSEDEAREFYECVSERLNLEPFSRK